MAWRPTRGHTPLCFSSLFFFSLFLSLLFYPMILILGLSCLCRTKARASTKLWHSVYKGYLSPPTLTSIHHPQWHSFSHTLSYFSFLLFYHFYFLLTITFRTFSFLFILSTLSPKNSRRARDARCDRLLNL